MKTVEEITSLIKNEMKKRPPSNVEDVKRELKELRAEMKKPNPDGEKIFELLCGDKYNKPIVFP